MRPSEIIEEKGKRKPIPDDTGDNPNLREELLEIDDNRLDLLQWYLKLIVESVEEHEN